MATNKALSGVYKPFDPRIKYIDKAEQEAARVQWSTQSLTLAKQAIDEGLGIAADPFFKGNSLLKKAHLLFRRTLDENDEWIRCKFDILHFAEKYCQLMTETGDYDNITLRNYQKKLLVAMQHNSKIICLGSRQIGKTTTTAIFILWLTIFHKNMSVALLGDKIATAVENLNKIKEILYRLPEWLKPGIVSWNVRSVVFDNRSKIFTGPCNKAAIVGKTLNVLFIDELAIPNAKQSKELVDFAFPTIETMIAQGIGKIILTSTPNGDNVFKDIWLGSVYKKNDFFGVQVPWYLVPGRDLEWRRKKIGELGIDSFNEQYNCQFLSSNQCIFSDLAIKKISSNSANFIPLDVDYEIVNKMVHRVVRRAPTTLSEPITRFKVLKGYDLEAFNANPHVITVDIAEGIGKDYTVFNVWKAIFRSDEMSSSEKPIETKKTNSNNYESESMFDEEDDLSFAGDNGNSYMNFDNCAEFIDFEQVAIFHSNEHCIRTSALFLRVLMNTLFDKEKCRIVIELNKYGGQFLDLLLNKNMYPDLEIDNETIGYIQIGESDKTVHGVMMSSKTKPIYVRASRSDIETARIKFREKMSIDECRTFGELPNGSFAASSGAHDDIYMTAVSLSAWATPENNGFVSWVEEYVAGNEQFDEDDDDEAYF